MRTFSFSDKPEVLYKANDTINGFVFKEVHELDLLRAVVYVLEHQKTGARLLHIHTGDPDNLLALAFRTPPYDDTGLPHILEYTVLCGSKKYPIKDPFTELYKNSMATFLNAMTYPDKTVYPCSSMVEQDFFNISSVYCDAVFNPLITENHFKQEGHHFDFKIPGDVSSDLIIKGIVYNEMKGAYSDLDSFIDKFQGKRLFAGSTYGFDSGGDPEIIPELTYQKFKEFHNKYYHPSNSRIFVYGNIITEKHLSFLDKELSKFEKIEIDSTVNPTTRTTLELREEISYPASDSDTREKNSAVTLSLYTDTTAEKLNSLGMMLLDAILLGTSASPLRKALIDSQLGEELTESGYASYQLDTYFTVGLRGCNADDAEKIYKLIMDTIKQLIKDGICKDAVNRALHQFTLSNKQIGGSYQRTLMDRVLRAWMYDEDPMQNLKINELLEELRIKCEDSSRFLESLLQEKIVDNKHYCLQTFVPDAKYIEKEEHIFAEKMNKLKQTMSDEDIAKIKKEAELLDKMQTEPNTPENLATLPVLPLSEVPKEPISLGTEEIDVDGFKLLYTDVFSNEISYLNLSLDITNIPDSLYPYLSLYVLLVDKMGAADKNYIQMAEAEEQYSGGISPSFNISGTVIDYLSTNTNLTIKAKALDENVSPTIELIKDKLFHFDLNDKKRFKDIVSQHYAALKNKIIESGHIISSGYAARTITRNNQLSEISSGVTQLQFFKNIVENFDDNYNSIISTINELKDYVLNKRNFVVSYVGKRENLSLVKDKLCVIYNKLGEPKTIENKSTFTPIFGLTDGIAAPSTVCFNSHVFATIPYTHDLSPALLLISNYLSFGYLWEEVRVKQGAYGCYAKYSPTNTIFRYFSYRDPNTKTTFDVYDKSINHIINEMDISQPVIEKNIIGTIKNLDGPIRPEGACSSALGIYQSGMTDELRTKFRTRLLSLTGDDIKRAAIEILEPNFKNSSRCILANKNKIDELAKLSNIKIKQLEI